MIGKYCPEGCQFLVCAYDDRVFCKLRYSDLAPLSAYDKLKKRGSVIERTEFCEQQLGE